MTKQGSVVGDLKMIRLWWSFNNLSSALDNKFAFVQTWTYTCNRPLPDGNTEHIVMGT